MEARHVIPLGQQVARIVSDTQTEMRTDFENIACEVFRQNPSLACSYSHSGTFFWDAFCEI